MEHLTESQSATITAPSPPHDKQAEEIARDLALMDELEAFVQSLPKRTEGRSPTTVEIREMANEDRDGLW